MFHSLKHAAQTRSVKHPPPCLLGFAAVCRGADLVKQLRKPHSVEHSAACLLGFGTVCLGLALLRQFVSLFGGTSANGLLGFENLCRGWDSLWQV